MGRGNRYKALFFSRRGFLSQAFQVQDTSRNITNVQKAGVDTNRNISNAIY